MKERDVYEITCVDSEKTIRVQQHLEKGSHILEVSKLFKALLPVPFSKKQHTLT
ncbi:hypothetical protein ACIQXV_19505 [Neobacillus sp. NPDC097160]|uniref:hypothetical protein n=1 Tax=Neobacillus sp. NPDC097160 TaxID=3364298 RepID=UPI003805A8A5